MKKFAIIAFLCLMAIGHLAANPDLIKIGVILPLSGDNAGLGQPQMAAVKLFQKECNDGHYKHQYQLIIEDNQLTPRLSAEAANKLIYVDHVDGIVSLFCDAGHVLAPMIKRHQIPHVNCVCSDDTIPDGQFNFSHWPLPAKECAAFVDLIKKQGGKRVAIVAMRQPGCVALTNGTLEELKKREMPAVNMQYFNPGERDFRVMILKIRQANPDTVAIFAFTPEMEILLRQIKQLDFHPRITTMECFDFVADLSDAEGLYEVSGGNATADFNAKLKAVSGHEATYGVPTIYDGLNLIRSAYEAQPAGIDHVAAARFIAGAKDFPSAMGSITVNSMGRIDSALGFYQIIHGKPIPVKLDQVH